MATAATAQAYTNNPLSSKTTGILVKNYYVDNIYYQEVIGTLDGGMYKRRKMGDTWSSWVQMATTSDNVASATKLATGRTLKVNLASTAASTAFNGTANITDIGVAGALSIANGGTGSTTAAAARTALGITPANIGAATSSHTHSYLPLSGGTVTGAIIINNNNSSGQISLFEDGEGGTLTIKSKNGTYQYHVDAYADEYIRMHTADLNPNGAYKQISWNGKTGELIADAVYGAVWNDYAEYRDQNEPLIAGHIAYCDDNGKLKYTTKRLQKFEGVISDTFGFAIGETDECKTPLAVSGRVLVYCDPEDDFHSGDCVCAGPNGIAYRMTREEIMMYPDRIVGVVSEIPTYERWGSGDVEVNGRIWIKVK